MIFVPFIIFLDVFLVIPNKPDEFNATDIRVDSALLKWKPVLPMRNFPPGLKMKIEYKSTHDLSDRWMVIIYNYKLSLFLNYQQ